MKAIETTIDRIVSAAAQVAAAQGLSSLTIAKVAEQAEVSTALIHYHFDTKRQLLVAAAELLAHGRIERRGTALSGRKGLAALDALWDEVVKDAGGGSERAWLELQALGRDDAGIRTVLGAHRAAERAAYGGRLTRLLSELGVAARLGEEETASALSAMLDGLGAALTTGEDPQSVRAAYDAFWLAMISAGQAGPRR